MRHYLPGLLVLIVGAGASAAESRSFPYEATVESDTPVRSGPGRKYYATGALPRGSRVVVRRHDPGGWYMISPPAGSFSWIRAEYVDVQSGRLGIVNNHNVLVRVGSELEDTREVWQRRLSKGDRVELIEQFNVQTQQGLVAMFKIKPPQGEYRWVAGRYVSSADTVAGHPGHADPFSTKPHSHQPARQTVRPTTDVFTKSGTDPAQQPFRRSKSKTTLQANRPVSKAASPPTGDRARLSELDRRLRDILSRETHLWDFSQLRAELQQLKQTTSDESIKQHVDRRLPIVARHQQIKNEYDAFVTLTSETTQRDAQLLAAQQQKQYFEPPTVVTPRGSAQPAEPTGPVLMPQPDPRNQVRPTIPQTPAATQTHLHQRPTSPLSGAGIIQRSAMTFPGAPRHVLLTPRGRVLAYLQAVPGVDLDRHVGQSMGLFGKRWYRRDLQSDFLVVQGLRAVRLKP